MNHMIMKVRVPRSFVVTFVLGVFLLFVAPTPVAHAATINVESTSGSKSDDGVCTLPEAIENANNDALTWDECEAGSGDDTIVIPAGYVITINNADNGSGPDANGLPIINYSTITINGNGATIQRSSVGGTPNFRLLKVLGNGHLTLNNVTIRNGRAGNGVGANGGEGGGIANWGTLVVNNSTISDNRSGDGNSGGNGGGIASAGTLTITNGHIGSNTTGNGTVSGGNGGGIYNSGTLIISDSTVDGNAAGTGSNGGFGGGIYNYSNTTFTLTNTSVTSNSAGDGTANGGYGGGIYNYLNVTASIGDSIVSSNTAGNGGAGWGGFGGGIHQDSGALTITSSTISGNTAGSPDGYGGGIYSDATLTLTNSTVSGNTTGTGNGAGGGIRSGNTLNVTSSTVANNAAAWNGGGVKSDSGTATLKNTIVANNTASSLANCAGAITNGGNNLDNGTSCGWGSANGSMSNADPRLGALAANGATRETLALQPGSPALDGVTWTPPNNSPATDERGVARPQGARHDIGAYEAVVITVNDTSGGAGPSTCKLRDAITAANTDTETGGCPTGRGPDTIVLPTSAVITLSVVDNGADINANGLPVIASELAINGNNTIIERSSGGSTPSFRIFEVGILGSLTLNNVTVRNGRTANGNPGAPGGSGGGIFSSGTLSINNSTFSGNRTGDGNNNNGGGGGAIYAGGGTATVTNSTISGNSTGNGTGSGNGGSGAGIYAIGLLTVTNSTITGNATGTPNGMGGALTAGGGSVTVTSSTIVSNTASLAGGGLHSGAGGITLRNTIVANNTAPTAENCDGSVTNYGNNLDSGESCGWGTDNGSMINTNPLLGALGNNGGPTQTISFASNSPARDGVTWTPPNNSPSTDQRGFGRPWPSAGAYDIGAFEWYPSVYLPFIRKSTP